MIHCNKPFIKPGYLGLVVIMMSVLFLFIFPPNQVQVTYGHCYLRALSNFPTISDVYLRAEKASS
jgi:hypothetical protein